MQLRVLTDNNTYIDEYYLGEPGLSYYLEEGAAKVLFDTGYSDVFLRNAKALGINLGALSHLVFSHGHNDHTRGFLSLMKSVDLGRVLLITHPDCFLPKRHKGLGVGAPLEEESMDKIIRMELTAEPYFLTDKLAYLGEIPRVHPWEQNMVVGEVCRDGEWEPDFMPDDSALAYRDEKGIFVITGCSHSGICNILTRAMEVWGDERICGIIGGMHLMQWDDRAVKTIAFLLGIYENYRKAKVGDFRFYPAHCTSFEVRARMLAAGLPVREVGAGLQVQF